MKSKELVEKLRGMSAEDLLEQIRSLSEELMKLRFSKVAGQLDQSHRIREVRQSIARASTILTEKRKAA